MEGQRLKQRDKSVAIIQARGDAGLGQGGSCGYSETWLESRTNFQRER